MSVASTDREDRRILGVGQLIAGLQGLLEQRVGRVWVTGEISNLHQARSGHAYFTLKDEGGQLRAALFRGNASRIRFELEEGLEVVAEAEVSIYAARGDLQLIVRQLEPLGVGALQLAFEQLRKRLAAAGLFDAERKRPIPAFPRRLGLVTSPTSAAIRDVLQVAARRFPATPILISPTLVQGDAAPDQIAAAIARLAEVPDVDAILLVRGGGSLEDLWAFNTEVVAHAIARSRIPVVAGVGHETDLTIADLVADLRAPTPSAAAMQVLPDRVELARLVGRDVRRLVGSHRPADRRPADACRSAPRAAARAQSPGTGRAGPHARGPRPGRRGDGDPPAPRRTSTASLGSGGAARCAEPARGPRPRLRSGAARAGWPHRTQSG